MNMSNSLFYKTYTSKKCSRAEFYKCLKKGMTPLEAIQPKPKQRKWKTSLFLEEMLRFEKQPNKTVSAKVFYQRLYVGFTKEEAFGLVEREPKYTLKGRTIRKHESKARPLVMQEEKPEEDTAIRVTYKPEEAKVFRDVYKSMIEELEEKYYATGDTTEGMQIQKKIKKIKEELKIFNSFNEGK